MLQIWSQKIDKKRKREFRDHGPIRSIYRMRTTIVNYRMSLLSTSNDCESRREIGCSLPVPTYISGHSVRISW